MTHHCLAFDRASVRRTDTDGRLHVATSHISIEQVADYLGREIPQWHELGLNPTKVYKLYRSGEELEKGASTFNNIPVLCDHVPVTAENPRPDLVVGSTGTDAVFKSPYLDNSLVVWDADAIELIDNGEQKELSAAYRYRAVMEPGTFKGQPFDGRMVDLKANHVALVAAGRAGPTVVVGDSLPQELQAMTKKALPSRMAILARGALLALVPQMAADAKPDFNKTLTGVSAATWKQDKARIAAILKPMMAQDADVGTLHKLLDGLDGEAKAGDDMTAAAPTATPPGADPAAPAGDPPDDGKPASVDGKLDALDAADPCADLMAMLQGKLSPEDMAAFEAKLRAAIAPAAAPAADADPAGPPPTPGTPANPATSNEDSMITKPAMDAALARVRKDAVADGQRIAREITEAERFVKPWVGELVAMDSASEVYKAALEELGVTVDAGWTVSAMRAILSGHAKPGQEQHTGQRVVVAMDGKSEVAKTFPNLSRIAIRG